MELKDQVLVLAPYEGIVLADIWLTCYKTLTGKKKAAKTNPKITALQVELTHGDSEIEKLVESDGRYTSCQMTTLRSLL